MQLAPFIDIVGQGSQLSQFNVTGDLIISNYFGTLSPYARTIVENCTLNISGSITADFSSFGNSYPSEIIYKEVIFSNSPLISYSRSSLNIQDQIIFTDCLGVLQSTDLECENVNCKIDNCDFMKDVTLTNSNNLYNCQMTIFNSPTPQNMQITSTSGSNAAVLDTKSSNITCPLNFDGPPCQWYTDSTSYGTNPTFSNGASLNNVFLLSLSNGIYQGSYTPSNYTPTAGSDFKAASVTGNLKGIDAALASISPPISLTSGEVIAGNSLNQQQATVLTSSNGSIFWDSSVDGIIDGTVSFLSDIPYYGSFNVNGNASSSGAFSAANTYMPLICGSAYYSNGDSFLFIPGLYTIAGVNFVPGILLQNAGLSFEVEFDFNISFEGNDVASMRPYIIEACIWDSSTVTQTGFTNKFVTYPLTPVITVSAGLNGVFLMNPNDILFLRIQNLSNTQSVSTTNWNASVRTIRQF